MADTFKAAGPAQPLTETTDSAEQVKKTYGSGSHPPF